jgi:hypothetical protein
MNGFTNFPEAFDFCRESNTPIYVVVGDVYKLFPSGRAKLIELRLIGAELPNDEELQPSDEISEEPPWVTEFSQLRLEELMNLSPDEEAAEFSYEPLFIWN